MRQKNELRGYQNRVATYLYETDCAMAVLKMGAGKTISTLTALEELLSDGVITHALVIAPKRVATSVWPVEIGNWAHTQRLQYAVLDGSPERRKRLLNTAHQRHLTIIGIDNVQWLCDQIGGPAGFPGDHPIFDCLVIDETSKLKDPKSKRGKALAKLAGCFKIRWGLTGTPRPNSLLDLFTPLKILTGGALWGKSFYAWQRQHFYPTDWNGHNWNILPGHEDILMADAASVSTTLAEGDMPDLPQLSVLVDEVVLPADARKIYRDMEVKLVAEAGGSTVLAMSQAIATGKTAQIANGFLYDEDGAAGAQKVHDEKWNWLEDLVESLDGEPIILVYEFVEDLAMIQLLFGDVPHVLDEATVHAWNMKEIPILALHPASGGHGLNLQYGGSRMAWIAPTWSAELWDQTVARLHRPGQTAHVMVHVCVAAGTVDELKRLRVLGKLSAQASFEAYLSSVRAA